jgi:hypothetical protein
LDDFKAKLQMRPELEIALTVARTLMPEEVPRFLGQIEEIRTTALARLTAPVPAQHSPDELLDVREAARRLGVSPNYLYHNHHRLPFTRRMGRNLLFSADGIQTYIRTRR